MKSIAMLVGGLISVALGRWIAISSFGLFIYEENVFSRQLETDLDTLDGLIAGEVQAETVDFFAGPQPGEKERTLEDTAGISTGVSVDIQKQIILRRQKEQAASHSNLSKELPPVRQYVQVNVLPTRDNPVPLPPAPDNLVKDVPENQA